MPVQDDERERELVRMFNLEWDPAHQRSGVDATLDIVVGDRSLRFDVEVKSTTGKTVSTARDVGMEHIHRWRRMLFVVGFYSRDARRPELRRCLCLTPVDMEPWIASIESKIQIDFKLAQRAARRLTLEDLHEVCGSKVSYSLQDAKRLHKSQWTSEQYAAALDTTLGRAKRISAATMLELLQLRSRYIAERGATLNNPHITKKHLSQFDGTNRVSSGSRWAEHIRVLATEFAGSHPSHPAVVAAAR
jgi:hypothetical protein